MERDKVLKVIDMIENLRKHANGDKKVLNCASIMEILINKVDDLREEVEHLTEENEALRFDLQDKKFEQGPRPRTRRERAF